MKFFSIFFFLLFSGFAFAQVEPGVRQIALGHSAVTESGDPFAFFGNPALVRSDKINQLGLFYSPAPFGMNELRTMAAAGTFSIENNPVGIAVMDYGFELYHQIYAVLNFGYHQKDLSIGGGIAYQSIQIKNYGNSGTILLNAGAVYRITNHLKWGAAIHNFTRSRISASNEALPTEIKTGVSYSYHLAELYCALIKETGRDITFNTGISYPLNEYLELLIGYGSAPASYSGGIMIAYDRIQVQYAVFSNPDLDYTHQFGVVLNF